MYYSLLDCLLVDLIFHNIIYYFTPSSHLYLISIVPHITTHDLFLTILSYYVTPFLLLQIPRPRSGFQLFLSTTDDCLYIYGGYSKEKVTGMKNEGRIHDDM